MHIDDSMAYICSNTFFTINNMSVSINRSNFNLVFLKVGYHDNPGAEKNLAGSSLCILSHILRQLLNTSASNNVSPFMCF